MDSPPWSRPAARAFLRSLLAAGLAAAALSAGWALEGPQAPEAATAAARERAPDGVRVERSVRYGRAPAAVLDVHLPTRLQARARPAVVVVHGGGWRFGGRRRMEGVATALARRGLVAFNVGYTLAAPGLPGFPRQLEELTAAIRWVRRNAARFGVDPARIGALGSSAGAHLAALAGLAGRGRLGARARVRVVVAWSGPFDLTKLSTGPLAPAVGMLLGCSPVLCPRLAAAASPVGHVSPDDPELLIVSSAHELVPLGQASALAERLEQAGVPHRLWVLPGARHGRDYAPVALGPSVGFLTSRLR